MAIQVSGVNVIDNQRNLNVGVLTATSLDVPPSVISFSPTDGSSDVSLTSNIVITFNANVEKGSGNITLRDGSASGTVIETIAVSSGSVSISGGTVTINPSDFSTGKDIYVVVDEGAFTSSTLGSGTALINTYNFTTGPITTSSFSPTDGATNQEPDVNIVITFSENITKETTASQKYIRIRSGSASGSVLQTIDVSTSAVSVSGNQATINPPSDMAFETDQYIVVDEDSFFNSSGDAASGNAEINTYNFTTRANFPFLGASGCGGVVICLQSSNMYLIAPCTTQVCRSWYCRNDAVTLANSNAACGDWYVPTCSQLQNPGFVCRTYWDYVKENCYTHLDKYWSNTQAPSTAEAYGVYFNPAPYVGQAGKPSTGNVRAFRTTTY